MSEYTPDRHELQVLVDALSLDQKAELVAGASMWFTHGAPEIGLQPLQLSDGPNGVRGASVDERDTSLCTPCGTALGASWDVELVRRVGELVGDEARRRAVHVVLGPTMNIHRSPLGGRGFECFSEDPLLSGALAAGWIHGVQSRGVAATPKHFVCNDAETARMTVDNIVDQRALREIYLTPFELATKAGAWAIMTAYNQVNGAYCSASEPLLTGILRDEWNWDGVAMTDWYASGDTVVSGNAGLDLEMPGPARMFGPPLSEAVRAGAVDEAALDEKIIRLLTLAARTGQLTINDQVTGPTAGTPLSRDESDEVLTEAAAAGFVLLKNNTQLLPLDTTKTTRIAVIGPNAALPCYQGGGAAEVNLERIPTVLDAITTAWGKSAEIVYEQGCQPAEVLDGLHRLDVHATHEPDSHGLTVEFFPDGAEAPAFREVRNTSRLIWQGEASDDPLRSPGLLRVSGVLTPDTDGTHGFSLRGTGECRLVVDGREITSYTPADKDRVLDAFFDPGYAKAEVVLSAGKAVLVEIEMTVTPLIQQVLAIGAQPPRPSTSELIDRAARAAADADAVVLVVGTSRNVEREGVDRGSTELPGEQNTLVARVLDANPATAVVVNAGTAVAMPWADDASTILHTWLPGQGFATALVDVLAGVREPGGRLPLTMGEKPGDYPAWDTEPDPNGRLDYQESVSVGYRHFDNSGLEPRFCFGHGLGYGTFDYERLNPSTDRLVAGDAFAVGVTVRNTSPRRSKEIVQLYVSDKGAGVSRPPRELKGFAAITLDPGETGTAAIELDGRAFSYWDEHVNGWYARPGVFEIQVGRSSRDIRLVAEVTLVGE